MTCKEFLSTLVDHEKDNLQFIFVTIGSFTDFKKLDGRMNMTGYDGNETILFIDETKVGL